MGSSENHGTAKSCDSGKHGSRNPEVTSEVPWLRFITIIAYSFQISDFIILA